MKKFFITIFILIFAMFVIFKSITLSMGENVTIISDYISEFLEAPEPTQEQHIYSGGTTDNFGPITEEINTITISSGDELMEKFIDVMHGRTSEVKIKTPIGTEEFYMNELKEQMPRFSDIHEIQTSWIKYSGTCTAKITYNDSVTVMAYLEGKTDTLSVDNAQLLSQAEYVIGHITSDTMTDYEKIKAIHDYIINNCTYKDTGDRSHSAIGALIDNYAVCEGYTEAFELLCYLCGIECMEVDGTAVSNQSSGNHAWNKVKLNNFWYNVDVTWDDPLGTVPNLRYDYFLVSDDKLSENHEWYLYPHIPKSEFDYSDIKNMF